MILKRISRLKCHDTLRKRQPASSWRGCHLGWHWPPGVPTQPTQPTNETNQTNQPNHPTHQHHHWCIPAIPSITKKREDISNSPAFNGKASARERRDTTAVASWAIATSVSAAYRRRRRELVGWFMEVTAVSASRDNAKFILKFDVLDVWHVCLTNLFTSRSVLGFRCPQTICKAWFNKNSFKTPGRSQLPTRVRVMIYQPRLTVLQLFQPILELWSQGFRCAGGIIQVQTPFGGEAVSETKGLRIHESTQMPAVPVWQ